MLKGRGNGILLHVSSLPSAFGIGDVGEGAFRFADFLEAAGQRYWQILPLHLTAPYYDNSPYMSVSAFAGNPLFVSPVRLVQEGLLREREIGSVSPFPRGYVAARVASLTLICEDLGASPPDFREVMNHFGFPGILARESPRENCTGISSEWQ